MTAEREKAINEWLGKHCKKCANNDDRGTDFVNCQAECEVQKDIGVACIHYEEYVAENALNEIKVEIEGGASKQTTMRYDVEEVVFEEEWKEKEDEETVNNNSGL